MKQRVKVAAAAMVLTFTTTTAFAAAANCARPAEAMALQTAQVQQQLMVAALSCNAIPLYNQFVTTYQKDLFAADKALQAYFVRKNPRSGTADYHAYKTRLANNSSKVSIGDMRAFCGQASELFTTALGGQTGGLKNFISAQPYMVDIEACEPTFRMAGGIQADTAPAVPGSAVAP
jgi:hypothetical protein